MFDKIASLLVFVLAYVFFVIFPHRRSVTAMVGTALLLVTAVVTPMQAFHFVNWNVMGIFFGMLVLAELLMRSNMPAVLAEILVVKSPKAWMAMLLICALASVISMFAENVATVLLIAPIAVEIARKLKISPVALLIGVAISSNLQGTATLIGDPPSMILAAYQKMNFVDFFIYKGRLSIFFFVQFGAIVSLGVLYLFYRRHTGDVRMERSEQLRSWVPSVLMGTVIIALVASSFIDPNFRWLSGTVCMIWAAVGFAWHAVRNRAASRDPGPKRFSPVALIYDSATKSETAKFCRSFDWDTTFFLVGVFVLVKTMTEVGWIGQITQGIQMITFGSLAMTFFVLVLASVLVSAFVDNVPYLVAMIPVAQKLAEGLGVAPEFLLFGLLIASCIGGNITPIGASANIVTVGYLRRQGYPVTFRQFMRLGVPFTVVATAAASFFLWVVWG